jgi:hypothetical protein
VHSARNNRGRVVLRDFGDWIMEEIIDLNAQIVALRMAVEGIWLSLLSNDADPAAQATMLRQANVAAIGQMDAPTPAAVSMRDAVAAHTDRLWGSIEWQLQHDAAQKA